MLMHKLNTIRISNFEVYCLISTEDPAMVQGLIFTLVTIFLQHLVFEISIRQTSHFCSSDNYFCVNIDGPVSKNQPQIYI